MGGSITHTHARFAAISLLVFLAVGLLAVLAGRQLARNAEEQAAAETASGNIAAPVHELVEGAPGAERTAVLDAFTGPLLDGDVAAMRVFSADGELIYENGTTGDGADNPSPASMAFERRTSADGEALFVTSSARGDIVVEVVEDASRIDRRIAAEQSTLLVTTSVAAVLLYGSLQGAFALVVRALARDHRRLRRLYVAGEELRSSLDLHDVVTRLSRDITMTARGDFGLVAVFEPETGDVLLRATYDHATGVVTDHRRAIEEWFLRRCLITNTAITTSHNASAYEQIFGAGYTSASQINILCVPMSLRDRVIGVVGVVQLPTQRRSGFAPDAVQHAVDLAAQGAMAIEQAQLFAKVRSYANEVEVSYDSTLKALMAALDAKDEVTEGHCERVAKLTVQLARTLGVKESALIDIERGALLHDVGKIGVPDAVLKKPDALNEAEWEAMRRHPLLAGVMISKVAFLEGATPILLYHHERYDGDGYPFRLAGEQIPLEARIFSVVDAYDAMTADRPYRDAMSHEAAMDELFANSGTQFDPQVVEAFDELMRRRPDLRTHDEHRHPISHEAHEADVA